MKKLSIIIMVISIGSNCFGLNLCLDIPNSQKDRVINSVTTLKKYKSQVRDPDNRGQFIPNPESKQQFVKRMLVEYLKNHVAAFEGDRDAEISRKRAIEKVRNEINIQ